MVMRLNTIMPDTNTPAVSREFSSTDGKRGIVGAAILLGAVACYWLVLPVIQSMIIPRAAGGADGTWVVRPEGPLRVCAAAVMACVTVPFLARPLKRKWANEDAVSGSRYDPLAGRPVKRALFVLKAIVLLIVWGAGLMLYLFSWETIGPNGIEQHLPWTTLRHSFGDIASLETIPEGRRSDTLGKDGPWYAVRLRSGRSMTWSLDNEGMTRDELTAVTTFVAQRSGLEWMIRSDTRRTR